MDVHINVLSLFPDKENNDIPSPLHTPRRRSISLPSESIHNLVTSMDCSLQTIDDQPMVSTL